MVVRRLLETTDHFLSVGHLSAAVFTPNDPLRTLLVPVLINLLLGHRLPTLLAQDRLELALLLMFLQVDRRD